VSADQFFGGQLFDRDRIEMSGEMQVHPEAFLEIEVATGNEVDYANARQGEMLRFEPSLRLNLGKHLRLNLNHTYETLDVEQGQLFTAALTQVQATYQFNVRTFIRWIGQHLDVLFLGYSDTYVGTQEIDLTQQSRTFFFKVGYAFML
ncbi:MAG: hypothetical protein ABR524_13995, partial [Thermoanaerobaculia bacterium]